MFGFGKKKIGGQGKPPILPPPTEPTPILVPKSNTSTVNGSQRGIAVNSPKTSLPSKKIFGLPLEVTNTSAKTGKLFNTKIGNPGFDKPEAIKAIEQGIVDSPIGKKMLSMDNKNVVSFGKKALKWAAPILIGAALIFGAFKLFKGSKTKKYK